MSDVCKQVCRLCLEVVPDGNCEPISEIDKEILEVLLIRIDYDISNNVACKECVQKVQNCFEFKSTCFYVDDYITPFLYTDFRVDIKKVFQEVMTKENVNLENVNICRLCMTLIENNAFIYNSDSKDGVPLKDIVRNCLPELDLNTVNEPSICESCLSNMERLNDFMKTCHEVEQRIKNYEVAVGRNIPGKVSIDDLLKFNNSKTLSTLIDVKKDHLDSENALKCSKNEDTSIKCEEIHIKNEAENGVQTNNYGGRSSKNTTRTRASASKGKKHFCDKCPYYSHKNSLVKKHMLTHSDNEVHGCNLCSFITNTRLSLRAHMTCHRGPTKRYGCPECTYETEHKSSIDQHILKHKDNSEVKMYKCPLCPLKTKYKNWFIKHLRVLHKDPQEIPKRKREMCDYESKNKNNIDSHMRTHEDPKVVNNLRCEKCPYKTKWLGNLKIHVMAHSIENPYRCDQCTFSTKLSLSLQLHKCLHQKKEEEGYKCKLCTYQARTTRSVRLHMIRTHTDPSEVSKLKCAHCPYETIYKTSLLLHIRRWHSIKKQSKVKCDLCTYVTTDKEYMRMHLIVHREATLQCYQCNFRTKWKSSLQIHMKRHQVGSRSPTKQQTISLRGHKNRNLKKKKKNEDKRKNKKKA